MAIGAPIGSVSTTIWHAVSTCPTVSRAVTWAMPSTMPLPQRSTHRGNSLALAQASYTNVVLTDTTNTVSALLGGTFDTGCLLPNVRGAC